METIKLKDGTKKYREMIWINGKAIKSPAFERKTDARDWKAKQLSVKKDQEIMGNGYNAFSSMTLSNYAKQWLKDKAPTLSRSSNEEYDRYLRLHILPFASLGEMELKDISTPHAKQLKTNLLKTLSPKTSNCIMRVFKSILESAVEDSFILKNPAKKVPEATEPPPAERFWSLGDIRAFALWASQNDEALHDFGMFALNTGMRRGEIAALTFSDIEFEMRIAHVTKTRDNVETSQRTKTNINRAVPLNDIAMMILQKRFRSRKNGCHEIFTEEDGSLFRIHHLYRRWANMHRLAKIKNITEFQDTRDTFATQFMIHGGDIYQLQKILGHTKIEMTMRYIKYSPNYLRDAVKGFNLGMDQNEFNQYLTIEEKSGEKSEVISMKKAK